jgi:SAM-dependent methyltransferase
LSVLNLEAYTAAQFTEEFRAQLQRATADAANEASLLDALTPNQDRLKEYAFAARCGHMSLGRSGLEVTASESLFGLYARFYHRQFSVAHLPLPGRPAASQAWWKSLAQIRHGPQTILFETLETAAASFDNIFFFRVMENLSDDEAFIDKIKQQLPPLGVVAFTVAYSHSGSKPFDDIGLFRVYDRAGLDARLQGLRILRFETDETAEEVAERPRMFDLTLAYIAAQKP